MGTGTGIEWAHHTFNPWRGCSKVSSGCDNCYAEALSVRNPRVLGEWGPSASRAMAAESYWRHPLAWERDAARAGERHRVFCASLSDVFEDRTDLVDSRARLFQTIGQTPHLDWLLLTKRPENIGHLLAEIEVFDLPPNVWLGTSVEDQATADKRIPHLLSIPARFRFLSCEPLLGLVELDPGLFHCETELCPVCNEIACYHRTIDWVIVGGESGPGARPMHPNWVRALRDQCVEAGVSFFFKQWGRWRSTLDVEEPDAVLAHPTAPWIESDDTTVMFAVGKKQAGRMIDGREWSEVPS